MEPAERAAEWGLVEFSKLLKARGGPALPDERSLPWSESPEEILGQGIMWRFDAPRIERVLHWLGPLERGLFAFDMLCTGLFRDADQPLVDRLKRAALDVSELLHGGDSPFARTTLEMPVESLIEAVRRLSGPLAAEGPPSAYRALSLVELAASPDEGSSRDAIQELTRTVATSLHLAKCTTWGSLLASLLLRVVGHRRAGVDLIEMAGDLSFFGQAQEEVASALASSQQPPIVDLYRRARALSLRPAGDDVTAVIADLRADLTRRLGGADLDAAEQIPGDDRVSSEAPLTDREASDLAFVALAGREIIARATQLSMGPLLDVGLRRPLWRYASRIRLVHLVARTLAEPPVETLKTELSNHVGAFGIDWSVATHLVSWVTREHVFWSKIMTTYHLGLGYFPFSRDAWTSFAQALLRRDSEKDALMEVQAEIVARITRQITV